MFAGWYWAWELYNHMPDELADTGSWFMNLYIDGLNQIDPSLPIMYSPFLNQKASPEATFRAWCRFFKMVFTRVHFSGEIPGGQRQNWGPHPLLFFFPRREAHALILQEGSKTPRLCVNMCVIAKQCTTNPLIYWAFRIPLCLPYANGRELWNVSDRLHNL